jgi:hypothetical protein
MKEVKKHGDTENQSYSYETPPSQHRPDLQEDAVISHTISVFDIHRQAVRFSSS